MGKRKCSKMSSEHQAAVASFDDPFTQTTIFKATSSSDSSAPPQTTTHNINIGRDTLPKRVRVQPPAPVKVQESAASALEKDKKPKPVCVFSVCLFRYNLTVETDPVVCFAGRF